MTMGADGEEIVPPEKEVDYVIVPQADSSSEPAVRPGNIGRFIVMVR